jgi:hypothetical protein
MAIIPASVHWWWFPIAFVCISLLTVVGASYVNLFEFIERAMTSHGNSRIRKEELEKKVV